MSASVVAAALVVSVAVVASRALAERTGVPYPVFLVLAGAGASVLPRMPSVHLDPKVVFLGFLPPLVYHAGVVTSRRELRANALPIGLGALGLVLATTFAVAGAVSAAVPELGGVAALALGAVVAPTDPVASTSVLDRLGGPRQVTTILEGESLVNDGIALALLSLAVGAATHPVGAAGGVVAFLRVAGGGTAFGLVVGLLASRLRRPLRDPASQIVVSLVIPFVAYIPADALGMSGVLAALTTGLVLGQLGVATLEPAGRLRALDFWQVLTFLLESALFVLIGLQLPSILSGAGDERGGGVAVAAAVTVAVVVTVRLVWWMAVPTLRWRPAGRLVDTGEMPRGERFALGWSGLRGAISLAAALSLPDTFPGRDVILVATFAVIVFTLLGQGTTLPFVLRRTGLVGSDADRRQRILAERECADAALEELDRLLESDTLSEAVCDTLRAVFERRLARRSAGLDETGSEGRIGMGQAQKRLLAVQHRRLEELHRNGELSYTIMMEVRRQIDLEAASLGA
ncbi:MAG TPA: Na+/H+ antiporter [Acidimicrobiales bacterium]|nr:Na+/H+ antiporter [Acidimicrobiales bacterium]